MGNGFSPSCKSASTAPLNNINGLRSQSASQTHPIHSSWLTGAVFRGWPNSRFRARLTASTGTYGLPSAGMEDSISRARTKLTAQRPNRVIDPPTKRAMVRAACARARPISFMPTPMRVNGGVPCRAALGMLASKNL